MNQVCKFKTKEKKKSSLLLLCAWTRLRPHQHEDVCHKQFSSLSPNQDQDGRPKQPSIDDNGDGTYRVSYIPDRMGRYAIVVKYGGDDIPASPYRVRAMATGDASKCTVTGR